MTTTITADFVLAAGQTLSNVDQDILSIQGSGWTNVELDGHLQLDIAANSFPVGAVRGSAGDEGTALRTLTIGATGSITVNSSAPQGLAFAIADEGVFSAGVKTVNLGVITVRGSGEAEGVVAGGGGFDNHGALTVTSPGGASGVSMDGGGDFNNSGTITITGPGALGVSIYNSNAEHLIANSGAINAVSSDPATPSIGLQVAGFTTLTNTGTIQADKAIVFVRDDNLVNGAGHHLAITNSGAITGALFLNNGAAEPVALNNSGHITGNVTLNNNGDSIINTGTITGQIDMGAGNDQLSGLNGTISGNVLGGDGNDTLAGGAGAGTLDGGAGADLVVGGRGAQALLGGDGGDTLNAVYNNTQVEGGAGDDSITLSGEYTTDPLHLTRLDGGDGNDSFVVYAFPGQALTIDGGAGRNTLEMHNFGTNTSPIVLHLNGDASGGAWVGIGLQSVTVVAHVADVVGGDGGQSITAPGTIVGGSGGDVLTGSDPLAADPNQQTMALTGADTINGGAGDDTINGLSGVSYLRGDDGNDSVQGGSGFDDINGNKGQDTIDGGTGGHDWLVGGQGDDLITGQQADILWGNLGNDTLHGGSTAAQLRGGQGDDSIAGGSGNEFISGDRGNDTMSGGGGADNFHSSQDAGIDKVLDFHVSEGDRVELDPGTTFTVSQVGADTVIDMGASNGAPNQMILVGVQMSTLHADSIFLG